jgi:nucleotide-binding universal stress UspA family protein
MEQALSGLDGSRVADVHDAAAAALSPTLPGLLLFVADTRPEEELAHAMARLPGRGPGRHHAEERMRHAVEWGETDVRAAVSAWTARTGRDAALLVVAGRPEQEIVRVATAQHARVIVLGGGRGLPGRYPGPGPYPLSPVARFVIDHAQCDVLLLRRYVAAEDRQA